MPADYLHNHPQFADLIRIVAAEKGIDPALVEKDYWLMHCLQTPSPPARRCNYGAKPTFDDILATIAAWVDRL